jgi:hypothetical protein
MEQYSSSDSDDEEKAETSKGNSINVSIDPNHVMECLMHHFVKHKSKWREIEDILDLINKIAKQDIVGKSKYTFLKSFEKNIAYEFHAFCSNAECRAIYKIKPGSDTKSFTCTKELCKTETRMENAEVGFVTFELESQLRDLLERNKNELILPKEPLAEYPIKDVWNTRIHRKILKESKKPFISLLLNTDGVQVFKSGTKSLWPIILCLNNLPLNKRFQEDNLIVCGFHMSNELNMALFLESLIMEVKKLNSKGGINLSFGKFEIFCTLASLDAPAKSKLQNMVQFNGFFGCPCCIDEGEYFKKSVKFSTRYLKKMDLFICKANSLFCKRNFFA